jgi:ubiquinone/menaquinone biosynthesis C-methylase UbiE
MGHNDRERRRLVLQGAILAPLTEEHLSRSGLAPGMRVLDFGCGAGDVTLAAARRVGPEGHVTAIDIDQGSLDVAASRAREADLHNVSFVCAGIDEYTPERELDAVIGRHILLHAQDPLAWLRRVYDLLPSGGIAAFQEFDFSQFPVSDHPTPYRDRASAVFTELFGRMGRANMGVRLRRLFLDAGFEDPQARGEFGIDGGPDSPFYEWLAESVRSVLPRAEALGIGVELVPVIDNLADLIREEAAAVGAALPSPIMVGCYARKN